jgi:hypothetical protein
VPSQDGSTVGIDLAEGEGSHAGAFEAEAKSADAAEEVKDVHPSTPTVWLFKRMGGLTARLSVAFQFRLRPWAPPARATQRIAASLARVRLTMTEGG